MPKPKPKPKRVNAYLEDVRSLGWSDKDILETAVADAKETLKLGGVMLAMGPANYQRMFEYLDAILAASKAWRKHAP